MPGRVIRRAVEMATAMDHAAAASRTPIDPSQDETEQLWAQRFDLQLRVTRLTANEADIERLADLIREWSPFRTQILRTAKLTMGDEAIAEAVS